MSDRAYHYVKRNETTRIPRRHVFLDSEAAMRRTPYGQEQTWRLAVARYVTNEKGRKPTSDGATYKDSDALWTDVSRHSAPRARTVVWAHNLGYDLRITNALRALSDLGWTLCAHNIANRGTWLQWRRDGASLVMVDSSAIWAQPLSRIGEWFGLGKVALPDDADSLADWELRCERDVEILATAVSQYLSWLEHDDMGNWQLTGAGQAYAHFRHRHLTHRLLVHADETALAAERCALWTGRTEAYWRGNLRADPIEEWDFELAYPRIAAQSPVPVRLVGPAPHGYPWERAIDDPRIGVLAEVDVTTDAPCVPTKHEGRILWPVGRFTTTLWSPELRLLRDSGARVLVRRAWLYRMESALSSWAEWVLDQCRAPDSRVPAWRKAVAKHWGRALIGRFAMTYGTWDPLGQADAVDVRRGILHDIGTGVDSELLQVGDQMFQAGPRVEWDQSMPMITGWVQSEGRARMWHILEAVGNAVALYVDTDSVLVRSVHHDRMADIAARFPDYGLRLKRRFDGITVWGPRQVVCGRELRVAGLPRSAVRFDTSRFVGETWQSFGAALKRGNADRVLITNGAWEIKGGDRRRSGSESGWTEAIHIDQEAEGRLCVGRR